MVRETMLKDHKYTSTMLSCKVSLKCTELNPYCECFWTVHKLCDGCCHVEIWLPVCRSLNLRMFALIVSAHPYYARKFKCHVIHERAR